MVNIRIVLCFLLFSKLAFPKPDFPASDMEQDLMAIAENLKMESSTLDGSFFYTAGNKRDELITAQTVVEIDKHLKVLNDNNLKTIMYMAYAWCELKNNVNRNTQLKLFANAQKIKINKAYEAVRAKGHDLDNINLHVCMYVYVVTTYPNMSNGRMVGQTTKQTAGIFIDRTFARPDLSLACRNDINKEIKQAIAAKNENALSKSLNKGLIWRAELLKTKYLGCPIVPEISTDQSKNLVEMLNYIKSKVANDQKVLLHPDPETPKEMIAENVKLGSVTYSKLRFRHNVTVNPSFSDPLNYKTELYTNSAAFIFYDKQNPTNVLFTIALFDTESKAKRDSLEKWMMGNKANNLITLELLECIFPDGDDAFKSESLPHLNKYMKFFGITTNNRIAHFLAQIGIETRRFEDQIYLKEDLNYTICNIKHNLCQNCYKLKEDDHAKCPSNKSECSTKYSGKRLEMCENPEDYAGDDEEIALAAYEGYMGRGFIHLTWKDKYEAVYNYCVEKGLNPQNFKEDPKLLSNNIEMAAMSACAFFDKYGCNQQADLDNFEGVMNIVNKNDTNKGEKITLLSVVKSKINTCK